MTGQDKETPICHTNLTEAIKVFDLKEHDVHDVFNIFLCALDLQETNINILLRLVTWPAAAFNQIV